MKKYEGKLAGILGTIIVHLIAAILFMSLKLTSLYHEDRTEFLVEFEPDRDFVEEPVVEEPVTLEKIFKNDDRFRDIVRNIANQPEVNIDAQDYVDRVKEEMIAAGQLGRDNFIDEQKVKTEDETAAGETELANQGEEIEKKSDKPTADELAAQYQGPTRIFYDLEGRYSVKLPIPIYKCEGAGTIVAAIVVDRRGRIADIKIDEASSTSLDRCLIDAALGSLRQTRFNADSRAPESQVGSITFKFVAQ